MTTTNATTHSKRIRVTALKTLINQSDQRSFFRVASPTSPLQLTNTEADVTCSGNTFKQRAVFLPDIDRGIETEISRC